MRAPCRRFGGESRPAWPDPAVCYSHRGLPHERRRVDGHVERRRVPSNLCSGCSCCSGWSKLVGYRERDGFEDPRLGQVESPPLGPAGIRVLVQAGRKASGAIKRSRRRAHACLRPSSTVPLREVLRRDAWFGQDDRIGQSPLNGLDASSFVRGKCHARPSVPHRFAGTSRERNSVTAVCHPC
jgi:hypothetical protein